MTDTSYLTVVVVVAVPVGLYLLHRALVAAEERGWVYYRRRSSTCRSIGSAMLEVHAMMEPEKRHILKVGKEDERRDEVDSSGTGPDLPTH